MKRLILMRHAKTEPWEHGIDDAARVLLPRGQSDAGLMASALSGRNWVPTRVLISSARRTRETWKFVSGAFPEAKVEVLDSLYLAGTQTLEDHIKKNEDAETLMLIGHNPGMHDLAAGISSRSGALNQKAAMTLAAKMPTSAAALFQAVDGDNFDVAAFRLVDYIVAKSLR